MKIKESFSRKLFLVICYMIITLITILCIIPIVNVLSMSLSNSSAVLAGEVGVCPIGFTLDAYKFCLRNTDFWVATIVSLKRVFLGVSINMILTILAAYPLSKSDDNFKKRKYYVWIFIITMIFNGGLIPTYIVVAKTHLIDTIWAMVLPGAVPVFNVILLMNFFRNIPKEIEESAFMDGAGQFTVLWKLFLPLSTPAIATVTLFCLVGHWNAWFDGLIYMNQTSHYPLQAYLQNLISSAGKINFSSDLKDVILKSKVNDRTLRSAQIFISMTPILITYPFLQKYFTTGLVLGSVKG